MKGVPQEDILVPWEQHMAGSLGGQSHPAPAQDKLCDLGLVASPLLGFGFLLA